MVKKGRGSPVVLSPKVGYLLIMTKLKREKKGGGKITGEIRMQMTEY
jgi:hypothetical protein